MSRAAGENAVETDQCSPPQLFLVNFGGKPLALCCMTHLLNSCTHASQILCTRWLFSLTHHAVLAVELSKRSWRLWRRKKLIEALKSGDEETLAALKADVAAAPDRAPAKTSGAVFVHCNTALRNISMSCAEIAGRQKWLQPLPTVESRPSPRMCMSMSRAECPALPAINPRNLAN